LSIFCLFQSSVGSDDTFHMSYNIIWEFSITLVSDVRAPVKVCLHAVIAMTAFCSEW